MYTPTRWKVHLVLRVCVILGDSTCAGDQKAVWLLRRSPVDRIPVHTLEFVYFGKVLGVLVPTSAAALCPETSEVFRSILAFRTACPWIWRYCNLPKRRAVEPQQHTVNPRRLLFMFVCRSVQLFGAVVIQMVLLCLWAHHVITQTKYRHYFDMYFASLVWRLSTFQDVSSYTCSLSSLHLMIVAALYR
jgi:hypothetical protein